jgi:hypothetical protein
VSDGCTQDRAVYLRGRVLLLIPGVTAKWNAHREHSLNAVSHESNLPRVWFYPRRRRNRRGAFTVQTSERGFRKKAAREEPPFLEWGRFGQKMNLPVIWAIL